jgi:putative transposase
MIDSYKMITRNMSRNGNCWYNAVAKSSFKTLKRNKFMVILLLQIEQMGFKYLSLLKFGITEKEGSLL